MLARSVGVHLSEVDVVDCGCLAFVGVDNSLVLGGKSKMRIDNVDAICTFQHARITRDNATLLESVVLHEGANGRRTIFCLSVKVVEIFVDGFQEGKPDVLERRAIPEQVLGVAPGGAAACVRALVCADSSCVFKPVGSPYAASDDSLESALGLSIEFAWLSYVVLNIIVRRAGEVLGTIGMGGFVATP